MNNNFSLTDKLGEIDGKFLDEYHNRRSYRKIKRKSIMKYGSIVASVMFVITISLAIVLPAFHNTPIGKPVDTSNGVIDNADSNKDNPISDNNKSDYSTYTVIYAEDNDYSLGDNVEVENVYTPPEPGKVRFSGGLYKIMESDEAYENKLFAVSIFTANEYDFEGYKDIKEWKDLCDKHSSATQALDNHCADSHRYPFSLEYAYGYIDRECETCVTLLEQRDKYMYARDEFIRNYHDSLYKKHTDDLFSLAETKGLTPRKITVAWTSGTSNNDILSKEYVVLVKLTKEQLVSFDAPDDLGVEFTLVPEWMDTGEEVVYRSYSLYPVTLE